MADNEKLTIEDAAVRLVDEIKTASSVEEWKLKATSYIKRKKLDIVDAEGNPVDATIVVNAAAPTDEDIEEMSKMEDEADGEDKPEDEAAKSISSVVELLGKQITEQHKSLRRETDARIKAMSITGGTPRNDDAKKFGFKHIGEQFAAIKAAAMGHGVDERLYKGANQKASLSTYGTGGSGADGGFLIAPDFRAEILGFMLDQPSIMQRCRTMTTTSNSVEIPVDQTTPWGSDGIQAYWVNTDEAQAITQSKPNLGQTTVTLNSINVLVPMTDSLLEDSAVALAAYIPQVAAQRINYKVDSAILNGVGAGTPLGIRNSGAINQVTRTTGTGLAIDEVADLMAAGGNYLSSPGLAFVAHHTTLKDIIPMKIGDTPIFVPAGGAESANVPARLMGYPLLIHQAAQALDNAGDLSLHDFSQYLLVVKGSGIKSDISMHVWFDQNQTAFRFTFRVGGRPWPSSTIADANGGGVTSPFNEIGAS